MSISILLVDDHAILRQGLRALFASESDLKIVGETGNGLEVLGLVDKLKPDVTILDLELPGMKGLDVAKQINERRCPTRVIVLSMYSNEAFVVEALKYGASAYVLKGSEASDLILAIHRAVKGLRFLSPPLSELAIEAYLQRIPTENPDPYETLTPRERQILHLAASGNTNPEIAEQLVLSTRTVEAHRRRMMQKLDIHNQTELMRYALKKGIISVE